MIVLTGYHGTTLINAQKIIKSNKFKVSTKNTEWLGEGIYFFTDIEDARWWAQEQVKRRQGQIAVLKTSIRCEDNFYLNLDDKQQFAKFQREFKEALKSLKKDIEFGQNPYIR